MQRETVALLGRLAHPVISLQRVLHDAEPGLVLHRETVLSFRLAALRQRLKQLQRAAKLFGLEGSDTAGEYHVVAFHGRRYRV